MQENEPLQIPIKLTRKLPLVFVGKILPVVVLLLITVIYSRQLSYEDYGKYQTMWVLISMAGTLLLFGLPAIILSTAGHQLLYEIKKYRSKIAAGYAFLLVLGFVIVWYAANEYNIQQKLLLGALLVLQSGSIIIDTRFIKLNLLKPYIFVNAVYGILFLLVHLYFLQRPFVLEYLMMMLALLFVSKIITGLFFSTATKVPDTKVERPMFLNHWLYTGLNEVTGIIGRWLDKIVLLYLLTSSEFAVYFNGSFEIPLFAVMISAMENVMLAHISQESHNKVSAIQVFRESFKLLSLIAFPIFCFFLFAHREFYEVIFQNKYDASIPVFVVSLMIIPLRITHYGVILQCYGKANQLLLGSVVDILLSLLLMLILYPQLGTMGIMLALVISTYLQVIFYLYASAKILAVKVYQLVPLRYLASLLLILVALFSGLSFLRSYISALGYLVTLFSIASAFVLTAVIRYFSKQKRVL